MCWVVCRWSQVMQKNWTYPSANTPASRRIWPQCCCCWGENVSTHTHQAKPTPIYICTYLWCADISTPTWCACELYVLRQMSNHFTQTLHCTLAVLSWLLSPCVTGAGQCPGWAALHINVLTLLQDKDPKCCSFLSPVGSKCAECSCFMLFSACELLSFLLLSILWICHVHVVSISTQKRSSLQISQQPHPPSNYVILWQVD